jgi:hypothetical protein
MSTVEQVLKIFGGGRIAIENRPLFCSRCDSELIPEYDRLYASRAPMKELLALLDSREGRVVKRAWLNGHDDWGCHYCGRRADTPK